MSKYNYNKDYFEIINSSQKAYWLGFLYADGCINSFYKNDKLKSMTLELGLCKQDKEHLAKFIQCLDSNVPIHDKINRIGEKKYESCRVTICCTKMCYDLIKLGCTPQKTFKLKLPSEDIVPKEYMKYFIEGYFDGDGCICITTINNKPHIEITISGIEPMLKQIGSFLVANKIITKEPSYHKDKRSRCCSMYIYGNNIKRFLDYIYKDSDLYLKRKYDKYISYYKDYRLVDMHGINWSEQNKAYIVTIGINGVKHRIGQTKNINEAIKMRTEAEIAKYNSPLG